MNVGADIAALDVASCCEDRAYVSFRNVSKTYDGETLVVRDLNLDVARGEFVTLLGPSGSGKTTTLMMLAGFEAPTGGSIMLAGHELSRVAPHKRNLGMVFQNYALFPHMSVEENVAFPLQIRRMSQAEIAGRVERILDMVHLNGVKRRRPSQLSGGQQQRVAVARALVFEPQIVLMDEPLGALDKKLREEIQHEIRVLHDRLGITTTYVTHDQSEALAISDRIAVFAEGILQQCGSPRTLYEEPQNAFVADFIGENNSFAGTVQAVVGETCRIELDTGGKACARAVHDLQPGERCILSIRPERVRIAPPEGTADNTFTGWVDSVLFKGDHIRAVIRVGGVESIVAMVPNTGDDRGLRAGASMPIGWDTAHCRAFRGG